MTARTTAGMWEARPAPGAEQELVDWIVARALPSLRDQPGLERSEVFQGAGGQVVVVTVWTGEPVGLPDPPQRLLSRPAQFWEFERVHDG